MTNKGKGRQPPKEHQFKPGESGNPRGRPRKFARAHIPSQIYKDFLKVLGTTVKKPGTDEEITIMEAFFNSLAAQALKGKPTAMRLFVEYQRYALNENLRINPIFGLVDELPADAAKKGLEPTRSLYDIVNLVAAKSMGKRKR
ncbi:MAG: DUF5681 domain-containing protein [Sphingobium sp.]